MAGRASALWQRLLLRDLAFPDPEMEAEYRRTEGQFQAGFISFWISLTAFFWMVGFPIRSLKFGWFTHPNFTFAAHFIPIGLLSLMCIAPRVRCLKPHTYNLLCLINLFMTGWTAWMSHLLVQEEVSIAETTTLAGVFAALQQNMSAQTVLHLYIAREQSRKYLWYAIILCFLPVNLLQFLGLTFASATVFLSIPLSLVTVAYVSPVMAESAEVLVMAIVTVFYAIGLSFHMLKSRRRQFQLGYQLRHTLAKEAAALKEAAQREAALKEASQEADTILNHLLKNVMADAAGCIYLFLRTLPAAVDAPPIDLVQATECLERGVAWCRKRQAILRLASGTYTPQLCDVDLTHFGHSLLQGRPIEAQFPNAVVTADPLLCEIVLENALTNAQRHCHPTRPGLRFTASLSPADSDPSSLQRWLTFSVLNRLHPARPPLTPELITKLLEGEELPVDPTTPRLSEHLGLQHLRQAALVHGMELHLEQVGDTVRFEAMLEVTLRPPVASEPHSAAPALPLVAPPNLRVFCVDDSPVARRLLVHTLSGEPLRASVSAFGETADEVLDFMEHALRAADIVVLDNHLDYGHVHYRGTALLRTLLDRGYRGLACVRSANNSPFDEALYLAAGAHCCVGKDVHPQTLVATLVAAYFRHHAPPPASPRAPEQEDYRDLRSVSEVTTSVQLNLPGCLRSRSSSKAPALRLLPP